MIQMLEKVHQIGLVFNDLKLDNIMVGDSDNSPQSLADIRLIDFGLSTEYLDPQGKHIQFELTKEFKGSMAMSSKYSMSFYTLSRRDDLISLTYLLIYMRTGQLDYLDFPGTNQDQQYIFQHVLKRKSELTPEQLCSSAKTLQFLPLMKKVHLMEFEEEPDYQMLQNMLHEILETNNEEKTGVYDWMQPPQQ